MYRSTLSLASVLAGHMTHFRSSLDDQTNWMVHKYYIEYIEFLNHLKEKKTHFTYILFINQLHMVCMYGEQLSCYLNFIKSLTNPFTV